MSNNTYSLLNFLFLGIGFISASKATGRYVMMEGREPHHKQMKHGRHE
jgi:hypothetical protein